MQGWVMRLNQIELPPQPARSRNYDGPGTSTGLITDCLHEVKLYSNLNAEPQFKNIFRSFRRHYIIRKT